MQSLNIEDLIKRTESICKQWHFRGLSLNGKVLVIKALCASLYVYRLSVLRLLSQVELEAFLRTIRHFLWNGGKPKIAMQKLYNPRELGGLKLVDLNKKDWSLKIQWVAVCKENSIIRNIANQFLPQIGQDLWLCNFSEKNVKHFMSDSFWSDVAKCWARTYFFTPKNVSQIAAQSLWFNAFILSDKRTIFVESAYRAGIIFLYNIWNPTENVFLSFQQICQVYGNGALSFLQYYGLIAAIPREWIRELKTARNVLEDFRYAYESFEGKMTGVVYNKLTENKNLLVKLCDRWSVGLEISLDYDCFLEHFVHLCKLTTSIRLRNFQFRFLHRVIFCAKTLFQWKLVDSPRCTFCNDDYETIEHLFFDCHITKRFLETLQAWFESVTADEVIISRENFFFCNHEDDLLNIIMLIAKKHIFSRRMLDRHPNVFILKDNMLEIVRIERYDAFNTRKFKPFIRKWNRLF